MNFQSLLKVESADFYIDIAFRKANEKARNIRNKLDGNRFEKSKKIELLKIEVIKDNLVNNLQKILNSFPVIDKLPEFYEELIKCTLRYSELKKSLGALNWSIKKINEFFRIYKDNIKKTKHFEKINQYRRQYYGRVSSILKQIRSELQYIEECRRIMKEYPTIKTNIPTVCIVGFPNVGKTTLLFRLTGSKPEINSYPFTTKNINVAYLTIKYDNIKNNKDKVQLEDFKNTTTENFSKKNFNKKIQLLDTPGTLNRFNKMNCIEKQAYLAIKYLANLIIYIFDLTEPYPIKKQIKLYNNLKKFNKNVIIYLSKTDLIKEEVIKEFNKKYESVSDAEKLKKVIGMY
jgi:nucleolar GTP-binding protein